MQFIIARDIPPQIYPKIERKSFGLSPKSPVITPILTDNIKNET